MSARERDAFDTLLSGEIGPVLVQGVGRSARRHAAQMLSAGTRIAGLVGDLPSGPAEALSTYATCREAVAATGARTSVMMVPPFAVLPAIRDALDAGLDLIVTVTEGVPVHDALRALSLVRERGATWVGPSTPGVAVPGRTKLGFLPAPSLASGPVGIIARSGTLAYELGRRLVVAGAGQSMWVGIGGDQVKGTRAKDLLPAFQRHEGTRALLVIGEVGGNEEEELAEAIVATGFRKPVHALIAGRTMPAGVAIGHAGALILGEHGTWASKAERLREAGATVHARMRDVTDGVLASVAAPALPATFRR
jgi:succinyl-CoA synthetase alpha subunit